MRGCAATGRFLPPWGVRAPFRAGGVIPGPPPPPPNLYIYKCFVEASTTPKTHIILTRLPFWGLNNTFLGCGPAPGETIEVQDKKREKNRVVPPFEVILGYFGGFPVKTVCNPGLPGNPSQQRKRYTTHRGSSQRSSRGSIWTPNTQGVQNRPSRGLLR